MYWLYGMSYPDSKGCLIFSVFTVENDVLELCVCSAQAFMLQELYQRLKVAVAQIDGRRLNRLKTSWVGDEGCE